MSIANKTVFLEQKRELENTLEQIANQLIWIERRYMLKVNEDILQNVERQEKEIMKIQSIIKVIQRNEEIQALRM